MRPGETFTTRDRLGRQTTALYHGPIGPDPMWPHRVQILDGTDSGGFKVVPQTFDTEREWFNQRGVEPPEDPS